MLELEWRTIEEFPKYEICQSGLIRHKVRRTFKKPVMSEKGYLLVKLYEKTGVAYKRRVHRLVAETFIPNPDNKPQVNHKDGVKVNNHVLNLEWVTNEENYIHSIETGLR